MQRTLARIAAGLTLSLAALPAAAATTIVINFDDLTGTAPMPATYKGVNFKDFTHYDGAAPGYEPRSGQMSVHANYDRHKPGDTSVSIFTFDEAVLFDGAWFAGQLAVVFDLFLDGQRVHTTSSLALNETMQFLASGYGGRVDEVRLYGNSGNWVMDDLTYTVGDISTAVPEPATWAMMILGFGMAGAVVRRRRGPALAI